MRSNSNQKSGSSGSKRQAPRQARSATTRNATVRVGGTRSGRVRGAATRGSTTAARGAAAARKGGIGGKGGAKGASTRAGMRAGTRNGTRSGTRSGNPRESARRASRTSRGSLPQTQQPVRESRTIGEIHREQTRARRQQSMERAAKKTRIPFIILAVVLGLIAVALIVLMVLSRTSTFAIEEIKFTGADHLTEQEVEALCPIPSGTTLLTVDTDAIINNLKRDAWVEEVIVKRIFPSTLEIEVVERKIAAIVEIPMGATQTMQSWAISPDGVWIMAIPNQDSEVGKQLSPAIYDDAKSAMHITGVPYGLVPEIGTVCSDANVNNALAIVSGMTTSLADQVKTVTATDAESTTLTLDNNVEIAFGTADNVREKERVCLQIMEENPMVVYINVRVPDRPTWRSA